MRSASRYRPEEDNALDDPLRIRKVRREVARVKTLIREKELAPQVAS